MVVRVQPIKMSAYADINGTEFEPPHKVLFNEVLPVSITKFDSANRKWGLTSKGWIAMWLCAEI